MLVIGKGEQGRIGMEDVGNGWVCAARGSEAGGALVGAGSDGPARVGVARQARMVSALVGGCVRVRGWRGSLGMALRVMGKRWRSMDGEAVKGRLGM
jgi:hypothetical protein